MATDWGAWQDWHNWIAPLAFTLAGFITGKLLERLLTGTTRRLLSEDAWLSHETLNRLIQGNLSGLLTLGGVYLASFSLPAGQADTIELLRKILFVGSMLLVIRFTIGVSLACLQHYVKKSRLLGNFPNTSIFENLIRVAITLIGGLIILQTLGISIVPILTALGVGGLAISLALQDTLGNVFSGINMIVARQIKVGDYVKLDSFEGFIEDISWRNTVVRQLNNNRVIIPNSKMASSIIINCSPPEMSLIVESRVAYGSELSKIEAITIEVAKEVLRQTEGAVPDFQPFVRFHTFGESGILFNTILRVRQHTDQFLVRHEFVKKLQARFAQEGIEIPLPQRTLHLGETDRQVLTGALSAPPVIENSN
ncbi:MAG TPA: mechanosensitive ion channel family protein [Oculatellaceae cyanobacterium]|jgi:small-conductance mechanosensitive channel